MPKFKPGDPVLIVGGLSASDRSYIGHATVVVESPIRNIPLNYFDGNRDRPIAAHCVDLTEVAYTMDAILLRYVYRDCDLMPLGPLDDEEEKRTQDLVLIHKGNLEVIK